DAGVALAAGGGGPVTRALGRGLVRAMPVLLKPLGVVGTAAMLWVGGGNIIHGLEGYGLAAPGHAVHAAAEAVGHALPAAVAGAAGWLVSAAAAGAFGLAVGAAAPSRWSSASRCRPWRGSGGTGPPGPAPPRATRGPDALPRQPARPAHPRMTRAALIALLLLASSAYAAAP
ncbi:MAG TPA: DUF808 family protein, partial [Geminicoccaceae bacterium]|nr:DUF808 family protein [Geminicoccaceae bacterium]